MDLKEIEFWEQEYLKQIFFLLTIDQKKMMEGLETKEEIRSNWEEYLGTSTSDFAIGSERIFYQLFNQFGKPNSSSIGSDMFFETLRAGKNIGKIRFNFMEAKTFELLENNPCRTMVLTFDPSDEKLEIN